jgi:hypothetical protein
MARVEVVTVGIDESFQTIGSDPAGRNGSMGLRIPYLPLVNATPQQSRYLFMLCSISIPVDGKARIRGMRKYVSLGLNAASIEEPRRIVEHEIRNPQWHPLGGNISWHLQDLGPPNGTGTPGGTGSVPGVDSFAFQSSLDPALLYETATNAFPYYVGLTAYTPPNGGQPYGVPLINGGYSTRYDIETPWKSAHAWESLDIPICGPRTVALYASVRQADTTAVGYALPPVSGAPGASGYGEGLSSEEQFLVNFPGASYWRIAGSLIVDT